MTTIPDPGGLNMKMMILAVKRPFFGENCHFPLNSSFKTNLPLGQKFSDNIIQFSNVNFII